MKIKNKIQLLFLLLTCTIFFGCKKTSANKEETIGFKVKLNANQKLFSIEDNQMYVIQTPADLTEATFFMKL